MHHDTCAAHVPWCMPGSLTNCFLWSRWRGKRSRYSWRMRNSLFSASGKRSMLPYIDCMTAMSTTQAITHCTMHIYWLIFPQLSIGCETCGTDCVTLSAHESTENYWSRYFMILIAQLIRIDLEKTNSLWRHAYIDSAIICKWITNLASLVGMFWSYDDALTWGHET